ncbi:MAG: glycosyltransferase [Bacteroidales bacterium]|nr:glycosyltransferase [Bacteroidales bacterium]
MLSICIPVYNVDVTKLTYDLLRQSKETNLKTEILLFDDGSDENYKSLNRILAQCDTVVYKELDKNVGRAAIRNLMALKSNYLNLLFIDSDSEINNYYLENYKKVLNKYPIVCGGRKHPDVLPSSNVSLRWTFGRNREDFDAFTRSKNANTGFISNNFLINKELFNTIRFDEQIKRYGHEDTMLGIQFEKLGLTIVHIDNVVTHVGLEENDAFIKKTRESIETLLFLYKKNKSEVLMYKHIKLLKYFRYINDLKLLKTFRYLHNSLENMMLKNFRSKHPSLKLFDLYKLCYFSVIYLNQQ